MSQSRKGSSTRDNEQMIERARKRLRKRAKRGLRGYPVATAEKPPVPPGCMTSLRPFSVDQVSQAMPVA